MGKKRTLAERIAEKTDVRGPGECWPWTANTGQLGQPVVCIRKRSKSARRALWEIRHGHPLPKEKWVTVTCRNQGCMNPDHHAIRSQSDDVSRFWEKVDRRGPTECWEWKGYRDKRNYGRFATYPGNVTKQAHRVSWELVHGAFPASDVELCVCHHCDNPPCVNPAHLFLGTDAENHADMIRKGRHVHGPKLKEAMRRARERRVAGQPESEG